MRNGRALVVGIGIALAACGPVEVGDLYEFDGVNADAAGSPEDPWRALVVASQPGTLGWNASWSYTMGYHFTPQVNGQVIALGGWFKGTKTVSLWRKDTGQLLASTPVTAVGWDPAVPVPDATQGWGYASIPPVDVQAGVTYTVAVRLEGSGGSWRNLGTAYFPRQSGSVRIEASTYIYGTGRPTNSITSTMYGQADVEFVPAGPVDASPPNVLITLPSSDGVTFNGLADLTAQANDDSSLQKVEFYVGSYLVGTVAGPGQPSQYGSGVYGTYSMTWNSRSVPNGTYALVAKAYDGANNVGVSSPRTIIVDTFGNGFAAYDATLRVPRCGTSYGLCDTDSLVRGRAALGPEPNAPNTLFSSCADGTSGSFHVDESLDRIRIYTPDGGLFAPGKNVRVDATVWAYSAYAADHLDVFYAADAANPVWTLAGTVTPTKAGEQVLSVTYTLPASSATQAVRAQFRYGGTATSCASGVYDDRDDLAFTVE